MDGFSDFAANSFFGSKLKKWPIETGVVAGIFESVPVRSKVKAEMFRRFSEPAQRLRILDGCKTCREDDSCSKSRYIDGPRARQALIQD
jgi:hypothetical protein